VKDFVLSVGLVEPRKNQLMLLHALRDSGLPIVIIGRHNDRRYYQLCRRFAPKGTVFIDHTAARAARLRVQGREGSCAAELDGVRVVRQRRGRLEWLRAGRQRPHLREGIFGDNAYFCDPASVTSIREAVLGAFQNHSADASKRARLQERFRNEFTWERAAAATLAGYHAAIAARLRAAA